MIRPFVEASELGGIGDALVLADVRWYLDGRSGETEFRSGHLPGAVFIDLDRRLAAPSRGAGRHPLPTPEGFAEAMASLGIGDGSVVVAYDDAGGVIAARLVWMLRATGHQAALLDGGLMAYPGPLELGAGSGRPPAAFTPKPWPSERLADIETTRHPANVLVDARDRGRYLGETEPVDPRPGHIPGALNLPCRENLDSTGRLLALDVLRERFRAVGAASGAPVISYCGSGVTACHNLLVLELCGFGTGRLYPGSWSQYAAREDLPAEIGEPEAR